MIPIAPSTYYAHKAWQFGFSEASTDEAVVLESSEIEAVVIATRHDLHLKVGRVTIEVAEQARSPSEQNTKA